MIQLHTADINYQKIAPLILGSQGIMNMSIKTKLSEYKEFDLDINQNLNHSYNFLRNNPESRIILKIGDQQIGFYKSNNIITHLLVIGDMGSGSDGNNSIALDELNASYLEPDFMLDPREFLYFNNKKAYFIKDELASRKYKKKYYEIKVISTQTNAQNTSEGKDTLEDTKSKIYKQGVEALKKGLSVDQQINKQYALSTIHFYSSILEIKKEKRLIDLNYAYKGSAINLLNQISPTFSFKNLTPDKKIEIQTGVLDNYDLVNQICSRAGWQWREKTLKEDNTIEIEVANFNQLPTIGLVNNQIQDNWFKSQKVTINQIRELFPMLDIDLAVGKFIEEGSRFDIRYTEEIKNQYGVKIDSFNIKKQQTFQGFVNYIDLYNFI